MKKERQTKKSIFPNILIFIIVLVLIISLLIYSYNEDKKIKETNVQMYNYLKCVNGCDLKYTVEVGTLNLTSNFNETCLENCAVDNGKMQFMPGQLEKGKLLMESDEYQECVRRLNSVGADSYKNCVDNLLPLLEERYPEVLG